jgi:serine/threonine protein kinase
MAKYEDKHCIDTGGFSEVWQCVRNTDGVIFAKKKLKDSANEDDIRRFSQEVRLLSSLDHPNNVKVISMRLKRAPYFYIMPFYKNSLQHIIQTINGRESEIQMIFGHILDGVEYAHLQGKIHRDLKPQNILLNSLTDVVVSDFGLGRQLNASSSRYTLTGHGLGTFPYMPPEQTTNAKNADERSDVYSLGRILYELYTGITMPGQNMNLLPPPIRLTLPIRDYSEHSWIFPANAS